MDTYTHTRAHTHTHTHTHIHTHVAIEERRAHGEIERQRLTKKGRERELCFRRKYCGAINVTDKHVETTNKFFDG